MNKEPMTRGEQTGWILLTVAAGFLAVLYVITRVPASNPYADCQRIIGWDEECKTGVAVRILNRSY